MADNIDPEKAKEAAESAEDLKQNLESLLKTIESLNKGMKSLSDGTSEVRDNLADASKTGEGFGDKLAGLAGTNSGFNKGIQNMVKGLGSADKMFAGFTKSLTANFNAMAVGISVIEKMFEATSTLVMTTDAAFVSFQKQTGALSLYGSKIAALEQSTFNYGITIDEAADAQASLVMTIRNFNTLSDTSQERLLRTTAILNELGVESGLTAQSFNFMTNSLGMTAEQADQTTREMFVLAKSMGMPPQEMAESFSAAAPQLAAFGNRATQVFQKLTVNARNANMEVADMLRIAEQFDRFDTVVLI
jgi:methyl-accepting chemotaxis protein